MSTKMSLMLYFPLLLYGITSWGLTYSSNLDAFVGLQNKFIHFSNQYDSPYPLFISSNILKINELHELQLASFTYGKWSAAEST